MQRCKNQAAAVAEVVVKCWDNILFRHIVGREFFTVVPFVVYHVAVVQNKQSAVRTAYAFNFRVYGFVGIFLLYKAAHGVHKIVFSHYVSDLLKAFAALYSCRRF
jgi:hypothetical protein